MREIREIKWYALRRFRGVVLRVIKTYYKKVSLGVFQGLRIKVVPNFEFFEDFTHPRMDGESSVADVKIAQVSNLGCSSSR